VADSQWNLPHVASYHSYHGNLGDWGITNESSYDDVPNSFDCAAPLLKLDNVGYIRTDYQQIPCLD
jgi:hypothetical protein